MLTDMARTFMAAVRIVICLQCSPEKSGSSYRWTRATRRYVGRFCVRNTGAWEVAMYLLWQMCRVVSHAIAGDRRSKSRSWPRLRLGHHSRLLPPLPVLLYSRQKETTSHPSVTWRHPPPSTTHNDLTFRLQRRRNELEQSTRPVRCWSLF